ncbi:MAG: CinA family protein, partial [Christensenellaceae bacterium]
MNHLCVILRNEKSALRPKDYDGIVNAYITGGYFFGKMIFLPEDDAGAIKSAVVEGKNFFDTLTLIVPPNAIETLKEQIALCYNAEFRSETTLVAEEKCAFLLPYGGEALAREVVVPFLDEKYVQPSARVVIRAVGVPPEELDAALREAKAYAGDELSFNVSERYGDIRIEIIYGIHSPKMLIDKIERIFSVRLAAYIYTIGDQSLSERLIEALRVRKMTISVAESFTGGGISKRLVEIPGVSDVYHEGVTAYANEAKEARLSVTQGTLRMHGAVSDETAYQMALGLINTGRCDLAIATTGIAGPNSDKTNKPVGLCYIAIGLREKII